MAPGKGCSGCEPANEATKHVARYVEGLELGARWPKRDGIQLKHTKALSSQVGNLCSFAGNSYGMTTERLDSIYVLLTPRATEKE